MRRWQNKIETSYLCITGPSQYLDLRIAPKFWRTAWCRPHSTYRNVSRTGLQRYSATRHAPGTFQRAYGSLEGYDSTIYALSTAPGRAAIAIVRVSGSACLQVYQGLCPGKPIPNPRHATLRTLCEPAPVPESDKRILDAGALILYFPAPETVTGEDVLEFHVHGGPATVKAVLAAIPRSISSSSSHSVRYAEPGEFTKRAFYNNRLDLTQVEALGATLSAETEQQRRLAVRGSSSTLAQRYENWRQKLLYARGELEALIDFSEDQHFDESPAELCASVATQVRELQQQLRACIQSAAKGELLRNGINVALVGAPNAGKSSLLNCVVGREAAIVSETAGTTRDVVEVGVDIGGFLCRFGDLAGLRRTNAAEEAELGKIEEEGIRRARERALKADVIILFLSVDENEKVRGGFGQSPMVYLGSKVEAVLRELDTEAQRVVCVLNKADLFTHESVVSDVCDIFTKLPALRRHLEASKVPVIPISCQKSGTQNDPNNSPLRIEGLLKALTELFGRMTQAVIPSGFGTGATDSQWAESLGATERQRVLLEQCLQHLDNFLAEAEGELGQKGGTDPEKRNEDIDIVLAAEHLRSAASCLAKITGKGEMVGDVEDVLGVVFEKFCVGK